MGKSSFFQARSERGSKGRGGGGEAEDTYLPFRKVWKGKPAVSPPEISLHIFGRALKKTKP